MNYFSLLLPSKAAQAKQNWVTLMTSWQLKYMTLNQIWSESDSVCLCHIAHVLPTFISKIRGNAQKKKQKTNKTDDSQQRLCLSQIMCSCSTESLLIKSVNCKNISVTVFWGCLTMQCGTQIKFLDARAVNLQDLLCWPHHCSKILSEQQSSSHWNCTNLIRIAFETKPWDVVWIYRFGRSHVVHSCSGKIKLDTI